MTRFELWSGIFRRTMVLSVLGGMAIGAMTLAAYGPIALFLIVLGGMAGVPLGVIAGVVLSTVGVLLLRPYRGHVIPIVTLSVIASCLVGAYLGFWLHAVSASDASGGPQSADGTSWDWVVIVAWLAALFMTPYIVWWYLKLMDPTFATGLSSSPEGTDEIQFPGSE